MAALALGARLVLSLVFAVAGAAKLLDRQGTRAALVGFGAPEPSAAALAVALPLAELTIAGLLLPAWTAIAGALGAFVLLAVFTAAIGWNLAHGLAPDCHCFGQLHSAPASWKTLIRNGALVGLAGFAVAASVTEPPTGALAWIGDLEGAELLALGVGVAAAAILVVGGLAFLSLMRSYGSVLVRLDRVEAALADAGIHLADEATLPEVGLEPGSPAPAFWAKSLTGETISVETLTGLGRPTVLLFTSTSCGPCKALLPVVAGWQKEHRDSLTFTLASDGGDAAIRAEAEEFELENVLLDEDRRLYDAFEANGTPSAVLLTPDGTIGSWIAAGPEAIEELVAQALGGEEDASGLPVGAEAPALELRSLAGETIALEALRGRDTLLLFWNPDCGFCRAMHDDLLAWERSANGVTPRLVVVSSGDEPSTRAEGFRSLVLLDEDFAAGMAFNANGTPMAVLVDAEGQIASSVAAGSEAVLALADGRA
jgi:thiol-disulfide isomerase/thioredoxin